jgi:hypothetical protein
MCQLSFVILSEKHFIFNKIRPFDVLSLRGQRWRVLPDARKGRPDGFAEGGANLCGKDLTGEKACDNGQAGVNHEQTFCNQHVRLVVAGQQDPAHGALLLT